jgi:hypothetical protein
MQPDAWLQIVLRMLPAIIVIVLGFVAATDKKTRLQWNNVLYQIGSIRPDQREDLQVGRGVKWPFFIVALFLLTWPIQYYRLATRTFEVKSDIYSTARKPATIYDRKPESNPATNTLGAETAPVTGTQTATQPEVAPPPDTAAAPATSSASNRNIYGQPR